MAAIRTLLARRPRHDAGLTLVELLVTMFLTGVVGSLVVGAVVQAGRVLTQTDDEERGLQDAKVILDRLGRDVRESRGVECDGLRADPTDVTSPLDTTCQAHLQLWVDANSDYIRQPTEVITWRLQRNADGVHYDVWRVTGTGAGGSPVVRQRQASSLIVGIAFQYDSPTFSEVQQVRMRMFYDSIIDRGSGEREVAFNARLRNKGDR